MKIPETCFECDEGRYEVVTREYEHRGTDGAVVVVPGVKILRCNRCGDEVIPAESDRQISRFVAEATEQLGKAELFAMLEASGLTQKDFAEAIGLGEKTFHRWLKGTQVVSRSMGYYLRAMAAFPEVFRWVRERQWRKGPAVAKLESPIFCQDTRFPALAATEWRGRRTIGNPARGFVMASVEMRFN